MNSFDSAFAFFQVLFVIVFIIIVATIIYQIARGRRPEQQSSTVIKEREVIKEIVKIRCPYCNSLYDEKEDKCPNCGGGRKP